MTKQQFRVLCALLHDGATNAVIARRLGIAHETVKCHMVRLYAATGTQDRTQLVVAIFRGELRVTDHEDEGEAA